MSAKRRLWLFAAAAVAAAVVLVAMITLYLFGAHRLAGRERVLSREVNFNDGTFSVALETYVLQKMFARPCWRIVLENVSTGQRITLKDIKTINIDDPDPNVEFTGVHQGVLTYKTSSGTISIVPPSVKCATVEGDEGKWVQRP